MTSPPVVRVLLQRVRAGMRFATRPLTLSQAFSSASNALALVIAAFVLDPRQFALFTLLTLVSNTLVGVGRAAVFQPSLIYRRQQPDALVGPWTAVGLTVALALVTMLSSWWLGVGSVAELALLGGGSAAVTLWNWMRFRAITYDRRWQVAVGDGIRFAAVLAVPVLPAVRTDAATLQAYVMWVALPPLLYALVALPRPASVAPYRDYAGLSAWQLGDFVVGQFVLTVPLLVIGASSTDDVVSGIRLAQGLLGPMNLLFAASVDNLVADGATKASHRDNRALVAASNRLAAGLVTVAALVVGAVVPGVLLLDPGLRGVSQGALVLGLLLVGTYVLFSGWAGIQATMMRLLGRQSDATMGRVVVAVLTLASFAGGYVVDGTRGSMIAGFALGALVFPAVFVTLGRRAVRLST